MKRIIAVLLSVLMLFSAFAPLCIAAEEEREYFEDGSYIVVGYEFPRSEHPDDGLGNDNVSPDGSDATPEDGESKLSKILKPIIEIIRKIIELLTNQKSVSKTKYASYYDSQGALLWTVHLTADFIYNGKSAVCSDVSAGCTLYDSDWKLVSGERSKSGNTASAHFTVRQYKLGVPLKAIEKTVTLTCDKDGNIR